MAAWRTPAARYSERNLGIAYVSAGEQNSSPELTRKGLELLTKIQDEFLEDAALWDWTGLAEMRRGRSRRAIRALERAVQLDPRYPLYRTALAAAYWEVGRTEQAIECLEHAIELDPGLEAGYHMLAEIRRASDDEEAVRKVWRSYLEWNPQSLTARARLGASQ